MQRVNKEYRVTVEKATAAYCGPQLMEIVTLNMDKIITSYHFFRILIKSRITVLKIPDLQNNQTQIW